MSAFYGSGGVTGVLAGRHGPVVDGRGPLAPKYKIDSARALLRGHPLVRSRELNRHTGNPEVESPAISGAAVFS
jgi:hypothetical protein